MKGGQSMKASEIKKNIYWVGALDPELRVFDIIMYTPYGTTYNSYVVKGSEKTAVFETVKEKFFDQYIERLKFLNIDIENISYIVLNHTEPDHAGSVAKLLDIAKNAKVVGSASAIKFVKAIVNRDIETIVVKDNDTLSLGDKTLKFINAPFLHWPDSIYTYIEEDNMLITCDSFGSHYCPNLGKDDVKIDDIYNDNIPSQDDYMEALKYYFDCIMGPFKPHVLNAIEKIKDLKIDIIAPGHGPILRQDPWKIVKLYKEWSTPKNNATEKLKAVICFVSAYGYTEALANKILEGIKSQDDFNVDIYNVIYSNHDEIMAKIGDADGIFFGSPTLVGDALKPILDILAELNPIIHGRKVAGAFGSYGWSGEAVPNIEARLKQLRMDILPGIKVNFKPTEDDLLTAFKYGESVAEKIREKKGKKNDNVKKNSSRQWKCIVCGMIYEGAKPPEICPACGAGSDKFIEVTPEEITFNSTENKKYVILGNGAAGFNAALAIRKRNSVASIEIISKENYLSYFRPQLSDYLGKDVDNNEFYMAKEAWYKENNIKVTLGTEITGIDTSTKNIKLFNKSSVTYDTLIIASGSKSFMPPVAGTNKKGVFSLRTLDDLKDIKKYISKMKEKALDNVVIVGGGLLGLESAWELKKLGLKVTVVEFFNRILPLQLDEEGSEIFKNKIEASGIKLVLADSAVEILGSNTVSNVVLKSGNIIATNLVLFSVGIRPETKLAEDAGLKINKGILVNDSMETNIQDIYACGDVSEFNGRVYGNWPAAEASGRIAGANASGDKETFKDFVPSIIFNAIETELFTCGDITSQGLKELISLDKKNNIYKKLFFKDDIICGGILMNDTSASVKLMVSIQEKKNYKKVIAEELI